MIFERASISATFEDLIVQKSPAWKLYVPAQSFVTWRSPLRGAEAIAKLDAAMLALGLVGLPAHPTADSAPAQKHARTIRFAAELMILFLFSPSGAHADGGGESVMRDAPLNDAKMRI